jgi:hypothetical protein
MTIENKDDEIIIRLSANVILDEIQKSLDFIRYKEILSKSKASQADADELAEEISASWWDKNKSRVISNK